MDDLEQQIKAWADASAPATTTDASAAAADAMAGGAPSPSLVPVRRGPLRGRWLAVAAAVVVLAAIGVGLAVRSDDHGPELLVQVGEPSATTASSEAPPSTTTSTAAGPTASDIPFDLLGEADAITEQIGSISAAQTTDEVRILWLLARGDRDAPSVDTDEQVVLSFTVGTDGCAPTLIGFKRTDTSIRPRLQVPGEPCEGSPDAKTFLVALDWAAVGDDVTVVLGPSGDGDEQAHSLRVRRRSSTATATTAPPGPTTSVVADPPTTTTTLAGTSELTSQLDLPTRTVASDGEIKGNVVIVNGTGKPITASACGGYFMAQLGNDDYQQKIIRPACGGTYTIPVGRSSHPVEVLASYGTCTTQPSQPDHRPCDADGSTPGLPPGEYRLTIVDEQHVVPAIGQVTITVT